MSLKSISEIFVIKKKTFYLHLVKKLYSLLIYIKFYFLIFLLFTFSIKKKYKRSKKKKSKKNILYLYKSAGSDDLSEAFSGKKLYYDVYEIPRLNFKYIFYSIFDNFEKVDIYDYEYFNNHQNVLKKKKYVQIISKILYYLKKFYKIKLIVNFNINYMTEIEIGKACKENSIKFITLQKESAGTPGRRIINKIIFKRNLNKYNGNEILCYNNFEKKVIQDSGIIGKKNIHVVGCARLDNCFRIKKKLNEKFTIVYYSIQRTVGLPIYNKKFHPEVLKVKNFDWSFLIKSFEKSLVNITKLDHINLITKVKTGFKKEFILRNNFSKKNNINFFYEGTGQQFLRIADLVIAFNSTTIFEAIAANIPVIIPKYDFKSKHNMFLMDIPETNFLKYAKNEKQLLQYVNYFFKNRNKIIFHNQTKKKILKDFMGNPNGKSGNILKKTLENYN